MIIESLMIFEIASYVASSTSIELFLKGKVPNLNEEKFIELAEDAKNNCPISGVLNCEIILNASLS